MLSDDSDYVLWSKGITYQMWSLAELNGAFYKEADELIRQARKTFEDIDNPVIRQRSLSSFEDSIKLAKKATGFPGFMKDRIGPLAPPSM